jgi:hypothetical protein
MGYWTVTPTDSAECKSLAILLLQCDWCVYTAGLTGVGAAGERTKIGSKLISVLLNFYPPIRCHDSSRSSGRQPTRLSVLYGSEKEDMGDDDGIYSDPGGLECASSSGIWLRICSKSNSRKCSRGITSFLQCWLRIGESKLIRQSPSKRPTAVTGVYIHLSSPRSPIACTSRFSSARK